MLITSRRRAVDATPRRQAVDATATPTRRRRNSKRPPAQLDPVHLPLEVVRAQPPPLRLLPVQHDLDHPVEYFLDDFGIFRPQPELDPKHLVRPFIPRLVDDARAADLVLVFDRVTDQPQDDVLPPVVDHRRVPTISRRFPQIPLAARHVCRVFPFRAYAVLEQGKGLDLAVVRRLAHSFPGLPVVEDRTRSRDMRVVLPDLFDPYQ